MKMTKPRNLPETLRRGKVQGKVKQTCEENDVVFLAIFGSFIRGQQKKRSDIDVAIEFDKNSKEDLLDLVHLEREL